jgi:acetyltransferase-like isoleucine patch superfamily enzyme
MRLARSIRRLYEARHVISEWAQRPVQRSENARDRLRLGPRSYVYGTPRIVTHHGEPRHEVVVGKYTSIAQDVTFVTGGNHHPEWVSTFPWRAALNLRGRFEDGHPGSRGPITIGSDAWIGMGAVVLSGVTIGDGAVVGAQAVVAKDVPPYAIAVGNPARVIRTRFGDRHIAALLELRWWDWPESELVSIVDLLCSEDVDGLIGYGRARQPGFTH